MARYDLAVLELAEPVTGVEPLPVAESDPPAGRAGDDPRAREAALVRPGPRATPKRYVDLGRPLVKGEQEIVSDAACRKYYATQPLQARLLRRGGHDLLARSALEAEPGRGRAVDVGLHGRQRRTADLAAGSSSASMSWSEWCGLRHDPAVFARVSKLRDFALGEPVWAPCASARRPWPRRAGG